MKLLGLAFSINNQVTRQIRLTPRFKPTFSHGSGSTTRC
jgi:hypothetical protein